MELARRLTRPFVLDAAFALVFTGAVIAITNRIEADEPEYRALDAIAYVAIAVAGLALAWRRRAPMPVLGVVTLAVVVYVWRDYSGGPVFLSPLIAMYTVATVNQRRDWILAVVNATVAIAIAGTIGDHNNETAWFKVVYVTWGFAAGFLGDSARSRREYLTGLEERARHLEETREEEARRQVAEERLHIARELHDVVAHSLSSINIQAGAGAHVADRHPDRARDALLAIKDASKGALDELRMTLGMLRSAEDGDAPRAPTPSLVELESLVDRTQDAGLPIDVRISGSPAPLCAPVDAAAYRIVQESLTNVLRHAGATRAAVAITYLPDQVEIEVTDDGNGPVGTNGTPGHGLRGMRERVALLGGALDAGPRALGGFRVFARLPIDVEETS